MKITEIKNVLSIFMDNSTDKAILIDGPWGCGKTYEILQFIKKHKDTDIYYLSLFGLESIDEINTALYQLVNKGVNIVINEARVITKAIKVLPILGDISEALEYQLNLIDRKQIKGNTIIIFDDLERLSDTVGYTNLLGYINSLFLSGSRFICLMSSQRLSDNLNRKKEFDDFKEKVFDRIFYIRESNKELIAGMFDSLSEDEFEELYPLFESNIRMAVKTKGFFQNLYVRFEEKSVDMLDGDFSLGNIIKGCIIAISICLKTFPAYEKKKDDKSYYDAYVKLLGCETTNGFMYYKSICKDFLNINKNEELVFALINAFKYDDYSSLDRLLSMPKVIAPNTILQQEFYYLSDDNKRLYCETVSEMIKSGDFSWDPTFIKILTQVVVYSDKSFSKEEISIIANHLVNSKADIELFDLDLKWELYGIYDKEKTNSRNFLKQLTEETEKQFALKIINEMDLSWSHQNCEKIETLTERLTYWKSPEKAGILSHFIKQDFYFPDLSADISHQSWTYAHHMTRLVNNNDLGECFKKFAYDKCSIDINNQSMKDRFETLIQQYIDSSFTFPDISK